MSKNAFQNDGSSTLVMIGRGMLVAAGPAVFGRKHAAIAAPAVGVTTLSFLTVEAFAIGFRTLSQRWTRSVARAGKQP